MTRPVSMARFDRGWPLAGMLASAVSALVLGGLCLGRGLPGWMAMNATTHAFYGPEAATAPVLDLAHTGLGAVVHVLACFFWAGVAVLLIRKAPRGGLGLAWIAGLAVAAIAGLVDYGLMPARLRPGWELVLPPAGVAPGLAAMGVGIALGLSAAHLLGGQRPAAPRPLRPSAPAPTLPADLQQLGPETLRHPAPHVIDQRQQRIDPADLVTEDPNLQGNGMKQPGDPHERPQR